MKTASFKEDKQDEPSAYKSIKVSDDNGENWHSRKVKFTYGIEYAKLHPGQLVMMDYEKYRVDKDESGEIYLRKVERPAKVVMKVEPVNQGTAVYGTVYTVVWEVDYSTTG